MSFVRIDFRSLVKAILVSVSFFVFLHIVGCGGNSTEQIDKPGKKIRYAALGAKVRGLDPGDIGDVTSSAVASQCYETLYQYHYLKRPYQLEPNLASEMPKVSDDGLTYTIKIRKDVYFVDDKCFPGGKGRQLKADDFIYAWKRIANIKYLSKNWWIFDGKIVGLDEFREYTKKCKSKDEVDYSRPVEGLKALDDFTLRIKLKKPWPQIVYLLAHLPTAPMAKEAVDYYKDDIINVMVGTGPFMLKEWVRGSKIILVRNPKFRKQYYPSEGEPGDRAKGFLDDAGKLLPLVDGIVYYIIEEDQPRWLLFLQGKIDASGIPKDFFFQAITSEGKLSKSLREKGISLVISPDPSTFWYGFNMQDPVVGKNLYLRRAMSCAFNRKEYIELFTNDRNIPAKGIFPPFFKEYDKKFRNIWCEYDIKRAREQMRLAEKQAGGKIKVTLTLPGTDTTVRQMGEFFKRSMSKIGLEVDLDFLNWPAFQDKVKNKDVQIFAMGWIADYPDGQNFLQLFYGPNQSPGPNNFNYENPEFDKLYRKVETMFDCPERVKLYRKMERIVCADCPAIFTMHGVGYVPYYKYLKNFKPNVFAYGTLKYSNIDLKLRKKLVHR